MSDPISILAGGFIEALRQLNMYVALGLTAAISALVLDQRLAPGYEAAIRIVRGVAKLGDEAVALAPTVPAVVNIPAASVEVPITTAKWLLIGISFVAGFMTYGATTSLTGIAAEISEQGELLRALCLHPGLATSHHIVRYGAVVVPAMMLGTVLYRDGRRLRQLRADTNAFLLSAWAVIPYGATIMQLHKLAC
jgi:hypothetical protein